MNELLAIVLIVVLCCVMFLAWLISMATCPDAMVSFLSGSGSDSKYTTSSRESRELIRKSSSCLDVVEKGGRMAAGEGDTDSFDEFGMARSVSGVCLQLNASRRLEDKKLSVVDEVDEQSTLQSTIHSQTRPSILKHPHITQVVVETHPEPKSEVDAV